MAKMSETQIGEEMANDRNEMEMAFDIHCTYHHECHVRAEREKKHKIFIINCVVLAVFPSST
eukprot:2320020-Ditylum_brightwellii.AAC.1